MRVPTLSSSILLLGALAAASCRAQQAPEQQPQQQPEEVITTSRAMAKMGKQLQQAMPVPEPAAPVEPAAASSSNLRGSSVMDKADAAAAAVATPAALPTAVNTTTKTDKAFWTVFYSNGDQSQIRDLGGNRMGISIAPWKENAAVQSSGVYNGGKLEFKIKSAAVMPGVITAVYLSSGQGRTGDSSLGNQDEIDLEFKGNEPTRVQSNVFFNGQENLSMLDLGFDSSADEHLYGIEWDATKVNFYIDGGLRRTVDLYRPLQNMQLHLSVWTTTGGWPGLIRWGGYTNWGSRGNSPVEAIVEFTSYPNNV